MNRPKSTPSRPRATYGGSAKKRRPLPRLSPNFEQPLTEHDESSPRDHTLGTAIPSSPADPQLSPLAMRPKRTFSKQLSAPQLSTTQPPVAESPPAPTLRFEGADPPKQLPGRLEEGQHEDLSSSEPASFIFSAENVRRSGLAAKMGRAKRPRQEEVEQSDEDSAPLPPRTFTRTASLGSTLPTTNRDLRTSPMKRHLAATPYGRTGWRTANTPDQSSSSLINPETTIALASSSASQLQTESQPVFGSPAMSDGPAVASRSRLPTPAPAEASPTKRSARNPPRGPIRTYGERVRSVLEDSLESQQPREDHNDLADEPDPLVGQAGSTEESYAELRNKYVIEDELGEGTSSSSQETRQIPLRSLTKLRSAGSLKRFLDELEYLLAGLAPSNSAAARRSSSVELLRKLCGAEEGSDPTKNTDFLYRLKATNSQCRIWTALRQSGGGDGSDRVLDLAIIIAVGRISGRRNLGEGLLSVHGKDIYHCLQRVLASANADHAETKKKPSRSEKSLFDDLLEIAKAAQIIPATPTSSPLALLVLAVLSIITSFPASARFDPVDALTQQSHDGATLFDGILQQVRFQARRATALLDKIHSSRDSGAPELDSTHMQDLVPSTMSVDVLGLSAQLIELSSGSSGSDDITAGPSPGLRQSMVAATTALDIGAITQLLYILILGDGPSKGASNSLQDTKVHNTLGSWLRILVSLTQNDAEWCRSIGNLKGLLEVLLRLICKPRTSPSDLQSMPDRGAQSPSALRAPSSQETGTSPPVERKADLFSEAESSRGESEALRQALVSDPAAWQGSSTSLGLGETAQAQDLPSLAFDNCCLSLALLTNILRSQETAAERLGDIQLDQACRRIHCAIGSCDDNEENSASAIQCLYDLFAKEQASSLELSSWLHADAVDGKEDWQILQAEKVQADSAFLSGCISVALGLALQASPRSVEQLAKGGGPGQALEALATALDEFSALHDTFRAKAHLVLGGAGTESSQEVTEGHHGDGATAQSSQEGSAERTGKHDEEDDLVVRVAAGMSRLAEAYKA